MTVTAAHHADASSNASSDASSDASSGQPGSDAIRERLVSAAAEVFAEKGYDRAGVAEIARRAGYTTGAIYGRFAGKAELLLAAIEQHSDNELDALFNEHRFEGKVTDILTTVGAHLVDTAFDSGQALLLEAFVAARRDPEVRRLVQGRLDLRGDKLAELVEEAKRTGAVDPALDTEAIVRFCHAVGFGFLLFRAVDLDLPSAGPWLALIARLVDALDLQAVLPGSPAAPANAVATTTVPRSGLPDAGTTPAGTTPAPAPAPSPGVPT